MKKLLLSLTICCAAYTAQAQDLIQNIPANSSAVVTIKGSNVTDLFSIKEFENSKIGQEMVKELARESDGDLTSLNDLGIDFNASAYYFLQAEKGVFSNYFAIPLRSKNGFDNLIKKNNSSTEKIKTDGDITYMQDNYDGITVAWNDRMLVVVISEDTNEDDDYNYYSYDDVTEIEEAVEVAVDVAGDAVEAVEVEEVEEAEEVIEIVEVEIEDVEETVIESTEDATYSNDDYYKKREERYKRERQEREAKRIAKTQKAKVRNLQKAKAFINGDHSSNNILRNKSYVASLGKQNFEAHAWAGDFMNLYNELVSNKMSDYAYGMYNVEELYRNSSVSSTLDFTNTSAVLNIDYTMSDAMAKHAKAMYNGKMNKDFFKYFNQDKMLGYMSVNASTEGLLTEYPKLMKSMFANSTNNEMATAIPLGADLLSVFLDEEAVGELVRGDMLFVVNDIAKKQVTYTTYDYDENYNRIPIEKTKEETVPDFIFMATSNGESIFNKLMNIAVKENEMTVDNGIYKFNTPRSVPVNVYAMHAKGVLFFATSKDQLLAIRNGSFKGSVSGDHKKNISKNTSAAYVNGKNIISQIPVNELPREFKRKINFLTSNTEDLLITTGKLKGNKSSTKVILNTPEEGHKNGLAYFINFIDAFID
ncbi:hypothetical protein [Cellulophaga lytica]|uniref:DUF4836 family protein n=1 Tax=Cellulophaga lytica (strain ATCC 23178 / DSM 7489 / JCM 8516 / NBRC 14961 / NCIMB 1423 / VKM B-1433 / Cy l20) TaxID=867900 RepID=F0RGR2_CELLC|nr:hypothetical protein [Cellulophaga lytica]ADY29091.1 hypothetical protein Celly_1263 [Cellulophaga lytica DSM 7489]MDO6854191.1 hypothetical protein [Cellulophaga lytica]WQG76737.1 hypothetical protein SR888_13690 [Cellulophaga lytica]SNQ43239.1 conserved exported hypothetical protein [Cellulophaga lytica]